MSRVYKGSRRQDLWSVPSKRSFTDIESAFQIQEYISQVIQSDAHDVTAIVQLPGSRGSKDAGVLGVGGEEHKEPVVDEACWVYEQLRRLAQDLSHPLISTLQAECSRQSCPEMKAGEWLYLCVAHGGASSGAMEQCCAIDYIMHTLDSATSLLNSPRAFPSRLQIPPASNRHFSSLARRLSRIFAHAYYHHREAFEQAEAESSLYARFLLMARQFDLVPAEFLVLPNSGGHPPSSDAPSTNYAPSPSSETLVSSVHSIVPTAFQTESNFANANIQAPISGQRQALGSSFDNGASSAGDGGAERRIALNRSRTDTMYMPNFDLAKLAAESGIEMDFQQELRPDETRDTETRDDVPSNLLSSPLDITGDHSGSAVVPSVGEISHVESTSATEPYRSSLPLSPATDAAAGVTNRFIEVETMSNEMTGPSDSGSVSTIGIQDQHLEEISVLGQGDEGSVVPEEDNEDSGPKPDVIALIDQEVSPGHAAN